MPYLKYKVQIHFKPEFWEWHFSLIEMVKTIRIQALRQSQLSKAGLW